MTAKEIVEQLKPLGSDGYKRIMLKHGAKEPILGVKIEELKKIQKKVKKDYRLALDLYDTGIYDAMYLAGLIADETKMTKKDFRHWLKNATSKLNCSYTVAWVAAESPLGWDLAMEWIDSKDPAAAGTGWSTLSGLVSLREDRDLDLPELKRLLQRVEKTIHDQPDSVRYVMNGFVISVGGYVKELSDAAMQTAKRIGKVAVDMGDTACKVPFAPEYIEKMRKRGTIGKKRKTVRC
jgi:3-methyladenine DNA glycosylase AlkD